MRLMVPPLEATDLDPDEWQVKWEKNWYILEKVLLGEDFPLLRSIQRAYATEVSTPSILGRNEVLNQAFHREVARMRDDEPVEIRLHRRWVSRNEAQPAGGMLALRWNRLPGS